MTAAYVTITDLQRMAGQTTAVAQLVERKLEALRVRDGVELHDDVIERALIEGRSALLDAADRLNAVLVTAEVAR